VRPLALYSIWLASSGCIESQDVRDGRELWYGRASAEQSAAAITLHDSAIVKGGVTDGSTHLDDPALSYPVLVNVTLDGEPVGPVILKQGGVDRHYVGEDDGSTLIGVDLSLVGDVVVHASHFEARLGVARMDAKNPLAEVTINLIRFDASDNEDYKFIPPGSPDDLLYCAHCHQRINASWYESPHRNAASNPAVQDMYAGVASAITSASACAKAGGNWWRGRIPGSDQHGFRCYLGAGALPDLNENCGQEEACDDRAKNFGQCANCHAPGINGKLGGRDLLDAQGTAFESGVFCDVCHKVESVHADGAPGIGGRLKIMRPSETPGLPGEPYKPLIFGPFHDVSQVAMGAVARDHFGKSEFCAGCHEYSIDVAAQWGPIDRARWPNGKLPIQTTFAEWSAGPLNPNAPCVSCHMPPYSDVLNAAGLENSIASDPGSIAGWIRPPGSVRQHSWVGPRQPESGMLQLAAGLTIETERSGDTLDVAVSVKNAGPGHALPTGLPGRAMVLVVAATCNESPLVPVGGMTVPEFGGALGKKLAGENWMHWPQAQAGQVIRVVRRSGRFVDYVGHGPFGDGSFTREQKGLAEEVYLGESLIVEVEDGNVVLERALPRGDVAYLGEPVRWTNGAAKALAGAPGFAFARVLQDKDGNINVPSTRARDIVSDNRILPQQSFTSNHQFAATCASPKVHATLFYRSFPVSWIRERQWNRDDIVMLEVTQ
jgi:hypothetical protein